MSENIYQAMFYRKSVRKYKSSPLPEDILQAVRDKVAQIQPLRSDIKTKIEIFKSKDTTLLTAVTAPQFLCFYSEEKEGYLINAGYLLQQMDLYFSSIGIGSCWVGMAKCFDGIPRNQNEMRYVIMMMFGYSQGDCHRTSKQEFKRKSLEEICDFKGAEELLEPVRLAPSSTNSQPWYFSGCPETMIVSRVHLGPIKSKFYHKMNQIDLGIALCHLSVSAAHFGKAVAFSLEKRAVPKGYEFVSTVEIQALKENNMCEI